MKIEDFWRQICTRDPPQYKEGVMLCFLTHKLLATLLLVSLTQNPSILPLKQTHYLQTKVFVRQNCGLSHSHSAV